MRPLTDEDEGTVLLHRMIREAARKYTPKKGREEEPEEEEEEGETETYTSRTATKPKAKSRGRHGSRKMVTTEPPTHHQEEGGTFYKIEHAADEVLHKVAAKSHIPFWGIIFILIIIVLVIVAAFYFCLSKYWRKFRESDKGAKFKGLDLKSVNLIGQLGKEKVSEKFRNSKSTLGVLSYRRHIFLISTCCQEMLFCWMRKDSRKHFSIFRRLPFEDYFLRELSFPSWAWTCS